MSKRTNIKGRKTLISKRVKLSPQSDYTTEPKVTIDGNIGIIAVEDENNASIISFKTDSDIGGITSESFDSNLILANIKEFDGDEHTLLIQTLPSQRSDRKRDLKLLTVMELKLKYKRLTNNTPNKSWDKEQTIEAILDEEYEQ